VGSWGASSPVGEEPLLSAHQESRDTSSRTQIADLVGPEAADLAYRGTYWLRTAYFSVFPAVPVFAFAASIAHQPGLWVGVFAAFAIGLPCLLRGGRIQARAGRSASTFLSRQIGYPVHLKSGGVRLSVWRREVERGMTSAQGSPGR
jgi:hypothetical protein